MEMFCYQCEQTAKGEGCINVGICGKQPESAGLQDLIIYQLEGLSYLAQELENKDVIPLIVKGLFTTVTNVNFDDDRLATLVYETQAQKEILYEQYKQMLGDDQNEVPEMVKFKPSSTIPGMHIQAKSLVHRNDELNSDLRSVRDLLLYGLKGMAAYADHAAILGKSDNAVNDFFIRSLSSLAVTNNSLEAYLKLALECGTTNVRCMEILDQAHTETYGHPVPTKVSTALKEGPAIIISGHDLYDLEQLLKQTQDTGINVYTHGEMLPASSYPELKKYDHLAGHFGTAWQNQQKEFDGIPAAILFTTNCIQKPKDSYKDQVFTTGLVGWPGVTHVAGQDFSVVIEKAQALGGFKKKKGLELMTGFGHNSVLSVADRVIEAVKKGSINHFFLIGGCDGAKPGRNYYTEFVEQAPSDAMILTLACGKFRFNHLNLGEINGIPRLLDIGQCNDAYSAVKIAQSLAQAFKCEINDLPLSLVLSWYEQKAVVVLLSLLALGIKGIRLGPSLPAFITPNVLSILVQEFQIAPITTAKKDLAVLLNK